MRFMTYIENRLKTVAEDALKEFVAKTGHNVILINDKPHPGDSECSSGCFSMWKLDEDEDHRVYGVALDEYWDIFRRLRKERGL